MPKKTASIVVVTWLVLVLLGTSCLAYHRYPRVANIYRRGVSFSDCHRLKDWDVVVLNTDVQHYRPTVIDTLRALNPDITLLAYFPAGFVWSDYASMCETAAGFGAKVEECDWWMYDDKGNRVGEDGYEYFNNLSTKCPVDGSGKRLGEWLAGYVADRIIGTGNWDGVLIDGIFEDPFWIPGFDQFIQDPPASLDLDRDGVADDPDSLHAWWKSEVEVFISTLRDLVGNTPILVGIDKNTMPQYLNGGLRENFPYMHGGWQENMFSGYGYVTMCNNWLQDPMNCTFMLCYWTDDRNTLYRPNRDGSYERFLRYTLTSALLSDGYYLIEGGQSSLWWEDYYDLDLGQPQGLAYMDSIWNGAYSRFSYVWTREFDHATIRCNPFAEWVILEDGTWLHPQDGRIEMHTWADRLGIAFHKQASDRDVDQKDAAIGYTCAITNPSDCASFAYVWANLIQASDTLVAGARREFLLGARDTDTLNLSVRCPSGIGVGEYCLEVCIGGGDRVSRDRDTMYVTRTITFETEKLKNTDSGWEGSLTVYPQPVVSSGEKVRMEVNGRNPAHEHISVRLYDIRGRLVSTVYEGRPEGSVSLEHGLINEGGEQLVPGVYFLSADTDGRAIATKKIVLLR